MTTVSGEMYAVGARRAVIFELNANGYPDAPAPAHTAYEGIEVLGVKNFELNIPAVRKITHVGNDRVLAYDFLPAIEGSGGTLAVAGRDLGLDAMIAGVKEVTVGEAKFITQMTDQQGSEPDVALFICQQAKDASSRSRRYRFQVVPKCVISATPPGMNENPAETKYDIAISPTTKHLWGLEFTIATDGCLEAGVVEGMSEGRPNIVAWLGDNVETEFNFPTAKPASSVDKIHALYVDGILDATATHTVSAITPSTKPTAGQLLVCLYEY
jgi:hypothetical protein